MLKSSLGFTAASFMDRNCLQSGSIIRLNSATWRYMCIYILCIKIDEYVALYLYLSLKRLYIIDDFIEHSGLPCDLVASRN